LDVHVGLKDSPIHRGALIWYFDSEADSDLKANTKPTHSLRSYVLQQEMLRHLDICSAFYTSKSSIAWFMTASQLWPAPGLSGSIHFILDIPAHHNVPVSCLFQSRNGEVNVNPARAMQCCL